MNSHQITRGLEDHILAILKSSRRKQGISIAELARRVGIDRTTAAKLTRDYINIDAPEGVRGLDWAEAMDATRRSFGNDILWRTKQ